MITTGFSGLLPRRNGSKYSRANVERLIWLEHQGMLHPKVRSSVLKLIREPYIFPKDIIEFIRSDERAWANYEKFPDEYKRIRIAYIDGARNRPEEFHKRLESFLRKTRENRLLGYGGIDKYFKFGNSEMKKEKGGIPMIESFTPIINSKSTILILGTLPGPESIRKNNITPIQEINSGQLFMTFLIQKFRWNMKTNVTSC